MARITVEDCLQKVNNRFALIHLAAKGFVNSAKGANPWCRQRTKMSSSPCAKLPQGVFCLLERDPEQEAAAVGASTARSRTGSLPDTQEVQEERVHGELKMNKRDYYEILGVPPGCRR